MNEGLALTIWTVGMVPAFWVALYCAIRWDVESPLFASLCVALAWPVLVLGALLFWPAWVAERMEDR